ncbi:hypothetical protein FHS79_002554 [Polymorphobacter multimanifer]|uniref:Lipoprotein n=1 Tax=Polymorphobacter multimanifer TaxID=1070431 RepID=A0A841L606_9SPHN|nr:hypothetical protein [Polymorphobacter multimanifer]MBB6228369.1 hypothetical protein [Polymorphobacter multimanifer]
MRFGKSLTMCAGMLVLCGCGGKRPVPIRVAPAVVVCPALPVPPPALLMPPARPAGGYLSTLPFLPSKTRKPTPHD